MFDFIYTKENIAAFRTTQCCPRVFLSRFLLVILSICLGFSAASRSYAQQIHNDPTDQQMEIFPLDLNLRIVWGGSKPENYNVSIEMDSGALSGTQQLGIDPNDPSFILKDSDGRLVFDDRETQFGGCDIRVQAKSNSRLNLKLQIEDPETSQAVTKEYSWSLKFLRDNPDLQELGFNDSRISIDRVPGDRLRVVTSRSHLVYNSDEPLNIQIQPYGLPWFSTAGSFECTLVRVDDEHPIFRKSQSMSLDSHGNSEAYDVLTSTPKEEGVYELRFKLEPKRMLPGIIFRQSSIDRHVQFVVYNKTPAGRVAIAHSQRVEDVASRWNPLLSIPPKTFEKQSLTNFLAGKMDSSRRFPFFEIAKSFSVTSKESPVDPNFDGNDPALSIASGAIATTSIASLVPGQMHRLMLRSSDNNASYRVQIASTASREQKSREDPMVNEIFDVSPTGAIDRVVHTSSAKGEEKLEVLFWPNSRNAKLEITNLNATHALSFTEIIVDVWSESSEAPIANQSLANQCGSILELHSANLRSALGSHASANFENKLPAYDDWRLFLGFARQIGNYCKANGFDSLAMTVHTEGGTLFPSSKLSSNARFDTGTFSSDGRDPLRKDIVELMYRAMSRYGVEFVPMLELSSPIREIEEARSKVDNSDLLQLRNSSYRSSDSNNPLYNPLSARVQQAIAVALAEFENRYNSHPNYRGFALRAANASHLDVSVPIDQANTSILDQFVDSIGGNLPKDAIQREQFIVQRLQAAYSQWMKETIAGFLGKLKASPRWISVEIGQTAVPTSLPPAVISPIPIGPQGNDLFQTQTAIIGQWNLNSPNPIHVAMELPVNRFDSSFARLAKVASPFQFDNASSLPYRNNSRILSKVRIWTSRVPSNSLLVSNSGAVSESIHLALDNLPTKVQLFSTLTSDVSNSATRLEADITAMEWHLRIAAGETLRIDLSDSKVVPMVWYSQETTTLRSLESALQSIEQAVSRLSIPQPRIGTLSNPSFESQNSMSRRGRLSGWTTSIDPNASVEMDTRSVTDGKTSIKIESNNSSSIAWIQSDPFALTESDRLFVSFQAAAEQIPQQVTISLSTFEPKSGRFETVAVRNFANRFQRLKDQPNWSNIGEDFSSEFQLASQGGEATLFRLQFELKGQGSLWLDDVSLSTNFLRDGERRDLRSELFLARTSLQKGDSSPAVAMLTSPRGRLVQWGDTSVTGQRVLVSSRVHNGEKSSSKPLSTESKQTMELSNDVKGPDTKQKPVKRLRNYWWPRKE